MFGPGDVRFFDRLARLYGLGMPAADRGRLAAGLARANRPVERVVDLAGGTGRATTEIDAPERVVLDAAPGMLRRVGERDGDLAPVTGDARRLPLADASVDAVTLVDALHHLPNQRAVAEEVRRVLRPGGAFVVVDFDPTHPLGRLVVLAESLVGFDSIFTGPDDLARFLSRVGFAETTVVDRGFAYTVVGLKGDEG
ncbi:class I SAM-dependent methyltransferase [Halobium salinum]|uniref:Class I SAM-dependent methyltransferase n=1 Tax=Halobium salinum TaxID=1364940 RepID=A0ABD5PE00_9EURY|nr:methyltransferase domain-containing protein [Halobium salinum]